MSGEHTTPVGTPVVIAPGRVVVVGEYAALAEGSAVEAAIGCYAKAQFVPRMESATAMVRATIHRIKTELGDVAAALPPGSVLLTNEDFRRAGSMATGLGGGAAMAVAAAGAVLESLGLALESRKPQVHRIAEAARRATQGTEASGADVAASTYGGLIRVTRPADGPVQILPIAPPAGLRVVVFSAGPSIAPSEVVRALERHAARDPVAFRETVRRLREAAQRFLDEVGSGQATAAVAAAGKYGEILQGLCAAAQAPIVNAAFRQAAALAQEYGGIAKPTGSGGGEIGVALFATPEAARRFRKACTEPLVALDGDLDPSGVRCEFPDNAVVQDLDESDSAETPSPEPEEFAMPTLATGPPTGMTPSPADAAPAVTEDVHEAPTARTPPPQDPERPPEALVEAGPETPARRRRLLAIALLALALALLAWLVSGGWQKPPAPPPPGPREPSAKVGAQPMPAPVPEPEPAPVPGPEPGPAPPPAREALVEDPAPSSEPRAAKSRPGAAAANKRKHRARQAAPGQPADRRAGKISVQDF